MELFKPSMAASYHWFSGHTIHNCLFHIIQIVFRIIFLFTRCSIIDSLNSNQPRVWTLFFIELLFSPFSMAHVTHFAKLYVDIYDLQVNLLLAKMASSSAPAVAAVTTAESIATFFCTIGSDKKKLNLYFHELSMGLIICYL